MADEKSEDFLAAHRGPDLTRDPDAGPLILSRDLTADPGQIALAKEKDDGTGEPDARGIVSGDLDDPDQISDPDRAAIQQAMDRQPSTAEALSKLVPPANPDLEKLRAASKPTPGEPGPTPDLTVGGQMAAQGVTVNPFAPPPAAQTVPTAAGSQTVGQLVQPKPGEDPASTDQMQTATAALNDAARGQQAVEEQTALGKAQALSTLGERQDSIIGEQEFSDKAFDKYYGGAMADLQQHSSLDPNRWWHSQSLGGKILGAISVGLSTFGSSLTHSPNAALGIINDAIGRDWEAQVQNRNTRFQLLNMATKHHLEMADVRNMWMLHAMQRTNTALSWQGAMNDSEMAKPKADQMIAQNNLNMAQIQREMNLKALMMEKELYEKQVGWNIQMNPQEDQETLDHAQEASDALNRLDAVRQSPEAAGPISSAITASYARHFPELPQGDLGGTLEHRASLEATRAIEQLGKRPMPADQAAKTRDQWYPVGGSKAAKDAAMASKRAEVISKYNAVIRSKAQRRQAVFGGGSLSPVPSPEAYPFTPESTK